MATEEEARALGAFIMGKTYDLVNRIEEVREFIVPRLMSNQRLGDLLVGMEEGSSEFVSETLWFINERGVDEVMASLQNIPWLEEMWSRAEEILKAAEPPLAVVSSETKNVLGVLGLSIQELGGIIAKEPDNQIKTQLSDFRSQLSELCLLIVSGRLPLSGVPARVMWTATEVNVRHDQLITSEVSEAARRIAGRMAAQVVKGPAQRMTAQECADIQETSEAFRLFTSPVKFQLHGLYKRLVEAETLAEYEERRRELRRFLLVDLREDILQVFSNPVAVGLNIHDSYDLKNALRHRIITVAEQKPIDPVKETLIVLDIIRDFVENIESRRDIISRFRVGIVSQFRK